MFLFRYVKFAFLGTLIILFSACSVFFETKTDRDAQIALKKLMRVQEEFRQDHQRYAKTIFEIEKVNKYNIKYHKGLIYMEIETADVNSYRAISLPAESTTARVFAHDLKHGGFYEMNDEETTQYVLGAFRSIQNEKKMRRILDLSSIVLVSIIAFLGIYSMVRKREAQYGFTYAAHFISLVPLFFSMTTVNHMSTQIAFSNFLKGSIYLALALSIFCLWVAMVQIRIYYFQRGATALVGLFTSIVLSSIFTIGTMVQTLLKYWQN